MRIMHSLHDIIEVIISVVVETMITGLVVHEPPVMAILPDAEAFAVALREVLKEFTLERLPHSGLI